MPGRPWTLLPTPGAERHQGVFAPFSTSVRPVSAGGYRRFFHAKGGRKDEKTRTIVADGLYYGRGAAADHGMGGEENVKRVFQWDADFR